MGLLVRVTSKNDSVSRGKHPMLVTHCEMRLQRLLHLKLSHPQILHDLQSSHARNQKEPKTNHWTLIPSCRWEKKSIIFTDTLLTNNNTFITGTVIKKKLILPLPWKLKPFSAWIQKGHNGLCHQITQCGPYEWMQTTIICRDMFGNHWSRRHHHQTPKRPFPRHCTNSHACSSISPLFWRWLYGYIRHIGTPNKRKQDEYDASWTVFPRG